MRDAVIIAPSGDEHACVVARRIEALGGRAVQLDTADYPSRWRLTLHVANAGPPRFVLEGDGTEVDDTTLRGVWWRRPRRYLAPTAVVEPHYRRFVVSEAREAFEGWLLGLGRRVINPPAAESAARKVVQLQYAADAGLAIPRSLVTNSPARAAAFYRATGPATVYKPFTGASWAMLATRRMSPDAEAHLAAVAHSPVIFQEEIPKVADVRVNVVDDEVFAARITTRRGEAPIDWRVEPDCDYDTHALPPAVRDGLRAVVQRLGLRFAACDLGLLADGRHVFFEVNPGGQWLFAEIMLGQPVSEALARALLGDAPAVASDAATATAATGA